jgi:hypothetical protein
MNFCRGVVVGVVVLGRSNFLGWDRRGGTCGMDSGSRREMDVRDKRSGKRSGSRRGR